MFIDAICNRIQLKKCDLILSHNFLSAWQSAAFVDRSCATNTALGNSNSLGFVLPHLLLYAANLLHSEERYVLPQC